MKIISGNNIIKRFGKENRAVLDEISLDIEQGEFVTIMGPSGSGKSTLMYILSGMDYADSGQVIFEGEDISRLSDEALSDLRRSKIGLVFQQPTFLKNLNLIDNIMLPAIRESKLERKHILSHAEALMDSVGILELANREITQVSGGQLQRAGICRALINSPRVLFGDEPTGALNSSSSQEIMGIFSKVNSLGTTIILVTHDAKVSAVSERVLFLSDGKLVSELKLPKYDGIDIEGRVLKISEKMLALGI